MKTLLTLCLSATVVAMQAQFFDPEEYTWEEARHETVTESDSLDKYVLKTKTIFNFYYEEDDLWEHYVFHKKYQVNSSDAIEESNKIYISGTKEDGGLIKYAARVISPAGTVKEMDENDWLTAEDEETEREYTYLALQGLESGSQVEYYYIKKMAPSYSGVSVTAQDYVPVKRFELDIISPWNLEFASKVYNMDATLTEDTTLEGENRLYLRLDSIPALKDESSTFRENHLVQVLFKLNNNLYTGKRNLVSYAGTAQNVVDAINVDLDKKEKKALRKIEKKMDLPDDAAGAEIIRGIENYLKANYHFLDYSNPVLSNIESIYENKAFNNLGAMKVYSHLLRNREIPFQYVYTCDRSEVFFDAEFETNYALQDLLLYFPEEDEFIDASSPRYRFGCISPYYRGHKGLFIEEMKLGENMVGVATVEDIPAKPATFTVDTLQVAVAFSPDLYDNELSVRRVMNGYHAQFYQPLIELLVEEEDRKEIQESILKYIDSEAEVEGLLIENGTAELLGVKPLIASGKLKAANFVEKAGQDYLFKVGQLIGPQSELYSEEGERKTTIQTAFARGYHRILTFEIPEGYQVENMDALKMDEKMDYNNEVSAQFVSDYTQSGNQVQVEIWEFYNEVDYPKEIFEDYRRVINAAADFNKITLMLRKV